LVQAERRRGFLGVGEQRIRADHQERPVEEAAAIGLAKDRPGGACQHRHPQSPRQTRALVRGRARTLAPLLESGLFLTVGFQLPLRPFVPAAQTGAVARTIADLVEIFVA